MKKVMVTGASGFIAKHIVLQLLEAGYAVRGSVRSSQREGELREALTAHLPNDFDLDSRLECVRLDLNSDSGWTEALEGVDALMHTASPVTFKIPKNHDELIRPAVDGTLRALKSAQQSGVKRVILTSSVSAIVAGDKPAGKAHFDETDWSDLSSPKPGLYDKSKTMAEQAAWEFVNKSTPQMELTAINPGMVLGIPLDEHYGASLELIERLLRGKDMALPNSGFPVVDVRDVATMHVRALETPAAIGERIIAAAGWYWFRDMAAILREAFPNRKVAKYQAPDFLIRILSVFDSELGQLVPRLGSDESVSNAKAIKILGMDFRDPKASLLEAAIFIDRKI